MHTPKPSRQKPTAAGPKPTVTERKKRRGLTPGELKRHTRRLTRITPSPAWVVELLPTITDTTADGDDIVIHLPPTAFPPKATPGCRMVKCHRCERFYPRTYVTRVQVVIDRDGGLQVIPLEFGPDGKPYGITVKICTDCTYGDRPDVADRLGSSPFGRTMEEIRTRRLVIRESNPK